MTWSTCTKPLYKTKRFQAFFLFNSLGFSGFWNDQSFWNTKWLSKAANQRLKYIVIQEWLMHIDISSQTNTYRILKQFFQQSAYFSRLPDTLCKMMIKFRKRNHRLPVETGRWQGVPFNGRTCHGCSAELGNEFHYSFICPPFNKERRKYLKQYYYKTRGPLVLYRSPECWGYIKISGYWRKEV